MITEDYVSFETAKLLKEKGFNEPCSHIYRNDGMHLYCGDAKLTTLTNTEIDEPQDWVSETFVCACPTLQMAIKWLRKEHNLYIDNLLLESGDGDYGYVIQDIATRKYLATSGNDSYQSPEEAAEAAIKYCLENLI